MSGRRIAVIGVKSPSGEKGGAERFYEGLVGALNECGADAELIQLVSDESCFEGIQEAYLRFYDLHLPDYFGVISTKAPAYMIRHPNHVCYLQHTMRVFYDMFEREFPNPDRLLREQRELILTLDTGALRPPRTREIFVIGKEVQKRLADFNGLPSRVLHQASTMRGFHCNAFEYVFMPGRLHRWKRVDLIIEAMRRVKSPVKLLISGTGEDEKAFRAMAQGDGRISFLGRVSDRQLIDLYAGALVVPFLPIREDFGLVTLEAFLSRKPVITCVDSGEPANMVTDGKTGFVCSASPEEIAARLDLLCQNHDLAKRMGDEGFQSVRDIHWKNVAEALLTSLGFLG